MSNVEDNKYIGIAKNIKIDLNKKASHIFSFVSIDENVKYTSVTGDYPEKGKRFVVIPEEKISMGTLSGYYALHVKEYDMLLYIQAEYKDGWQEKCRHVFYWKDDRLYYAGGINKDGFITNDWIDCNYCDVDICGQAVIADINGTKRPVKTHYVEAGDTSAANAGYLEEIFSFFEGDVFYFSNSWNVYFRLNLIEKSFMEDLTDVLSSTEITRGKNRRGNGKYCFEENLPDIPKEAANMMKKYTLAKAEANILSDNPLDNGITGDLTMSCIQVVGTDAWERCFSPVLIYGYPKENTKVELIEVTRENLSISATDTDIEDDSGEYNYLRKNIVVFADDLSNTCLKYTGAIIKNWLDMLNDALDDKKEKSSQYKRFCNIGDNFHKKYGINVLCVINAAIIMAKIPIIEMMYNADFNGEKKLRPFISYKINRYALDNEEDLQSYVGELEEKDTLCGILGIPKYMLEHFADIDWIIGIKFIKYLFNTKEEKKYLKNIDNKSAIYLVDSIKKIFELSENFNNIMFILKKLFLLYGYKNWKFYIDFLMRYMNKPDLAQWVTGEYKDYITMLAAIGEPAKKEPWGIGPDMVWIKIKSLREAYNLSTCNTKKMAADMAIKIREEEFKKLCYENGPYIITYPKTSDDIITEGSVLHHCAKSFVSSVADCCSTILFIRKKSNPDKPFYTLEIRNGVIRQCHGFANKNTDQEEDLDEFLKKFCEAKNIVYKPGNKAYGAE